MNEDILETAITNADEKVCRDCLALMLSAHAAPVFGAAKPIEHEVVAFQALQTIGVLSPAPDEYELVTTLRVTKPKARALLYQVALRRMETAAPVDDQLREVLSNPMVLKDRSTVLVEVPDPLRMDMLRQRVRQLGYLSDGSFSGTIARIPVGALSALIADLVPDAAQKDAKKKLRAQGIEGASLAALISGARIGEYIGDLLSGGAEKGLTWLSKKENE